MFKLYYNLTKPGIIYGNAINTAAGFFLASQGSYNFKLLIMALVGISLVVGSACVFNNIWDKDIDAKMDRTKNRAMVEGTVSKPGAIVFGIILLILGSCTLYPTPLALYTALFGFLVYVFLYTPLKRRTIYATLVGAVAGAVPPVVGYTAVTGKLDLGAIILFAIILFWQMPHFYAIAIYRLKDYAAANIPVWPVKKGVRDTKLHMLFHLIAFAICVALLTVYHYTGYVYFIVMMLLALTWLYKGIKGFKAVDSDKWARQMFRFSLIIVLVFCIIIPLDAIFR